MAFGRLPLFKGTLTHPVTQYVAVPVHQGCIGVHIGWKDATSSATITLELSSYDAIEAPYDVAGSAWEWRDSGLTITGPAASAAGATVVNVDNVRQRRARLKIVTAATSVLEIHDGADLVERG
jgi:hypothetical protein